MVPEGGFETPTGITHPPPQDGVSTNSTTSAFNSLMKKVSPVLRLYSTAAFAAQTAAQQHCCKATQPYFFGSGQAPEVEPASLRVLPEP